MGDSDTLTKILVTITILGIFAIAACVGIVRSNNANVQYCLNKLDNNPSEKQVELCLQFKTGA